MNIQKQNFTIYLFTTMSMKFFLSIAGAVFLDGLSAIVLRGAPWLLTEDSVLFNGVPKKT
jgi:hypothetical protein